MALTVEFLFEDSTSISPEGSVTKYYRLSQPPSRKIVRVHRHGPYPANCTMEVLTDELGWQLILTEPGDTDEKLELLLERAGTVLGLDGT